MITDLALVETAKALAVESYVTPSYLVWGSSAIVENASSTSLSGEAFSRNTTTDSRVYNTVTWTAIKSGALASSSGDLLYSVGLNNSSSGGTHLAEKLLSSLTHTTAFDVEIVWNWTVSRG